MKKRTKLYIVAKFGGIDNLCGDIKDGYSIHPMGPIRIIIKL